MQQLNIRGKIRVRLWIRTPSEAERDEHETTQLTFRIWCTCCVKGKVSGQLNRCCSSDHKVPEMQMDHFHEKYRNSDRISSNSQACSAETCETRIETPSLNLFRGKQGNASRTARTDLRVARLGCVSEMKVELMTVSSILD